MVTTTRGGRRPSKMAGIYAVRATDDPGNGITFPTRSWSQ